MPTTHIRPSKRTIPKKKSSDEGTNYCTANTAATASVAEKFDLDNLLERTRSRMAKALNVSPASETIVNKTVTAATSTATKQFDTSSFNEKKRESDRLTPQREGILKQNSKYGHSEHQTNGTSSKTVDTLDVKNKSINKASQFQKERKKMEEATLAEEMGFIDQQLEDQGGLIEPPKKVPFIQDLVVERSNPKPDPYPEQQQDPNIVLHDEESDIKKNRIDENKDRKNEEIETDIEFSAMTVEGYKETVKMAHSMGISIEEYMKSQQEHDEQTNEKKDGDRDIDPAAEEKDELHNMSQEETDDDDDFLSFFAAGDDDEEESITPVVRPFITLYNALIDWITYDTMQILKKWKTVEYSKENGEDLTVKDSNMNSDDSTNNSDVYSSRCTGLMAMIKLHMSTALSDLKYNSQDGYTRKTAEVRLADLIQTFDFSRPMAKLNSEMWVGMTTVLLGIVLPSSSLFTLLSPTQKEENDDIDSLPPSLEKIGLTMEEYKYLTNTMVTSIFGGAAS